MAEYKMQPRGWRARTKKEREGKRTREETDGQTHAHTQSTHRQTDTDSRTNSTDTAGADTLDRARGKYTHTHTPTHKQTKQAPDTPRKVGRTARHNHSMKATDRHNKQKPQKATTHDRHATNAPAPRKDHDAPRSRARKTASAAPQRKPASYRPARRVRRARQQVRKGADNGRRQAGQGNGETHRPAPQTREESQLRKGSKIATLRRTAFDRSSRQRKASTTRTRKPAAKPMEKREEATDASGSLRKAASRREGSSQD